MDNSKATNKPSSEERYRSTVFREFPESELRVIDEDERIAELSFSSEAPIERWGDIEILSHRNGAADLTRLNTAGCLLFNHDRDRVIGKIIEAKIKNRRGVARVQFDEDENSTVIYDKVRSGTLKGVSVGYVVREVEKKMNGKGKASQITYTATKWEPLEISIVTVPADISVGVGRSFSEITIKPETPRLNIAKKINKINQSKLRKVEIENG